MITGYRFSSVSGCRFDKIFYMKQFILIVCSTLFIATIGCSQKLKVPAAVTTAFNSKFPGASGVKWEKENSKELEANFKLNNTDVSANFMLDGTWVETETTIPSSELPAAVTNAVNTKYPGAVYSLVEKIEKPGKILYEVNIKVKGKKKELELDGNGNIVE